MEVRDGIEVEVTADPVSAGSAGGGTGGFSIDFGDDSAPSIDFGAEPSIDFGGEPSIDFGAEPSIDFGAEPSIDFGGADEPTIDFGAEPTIDFGAEPTIDFGTEPSIDFGDEPTINFGDEPAIDFGGGIDFGDGGGASIDFGDSSGIDWTAAIVCEAEGTEKRKMTQSEANTSLLETAESRNEATNELMELAAFLEQRMQDISSKSDAQAFNEYASAPALVQETGTQQLEAWLAASKAVLAELTSPKTRQLIQINESIGHVDRLADALVLNRNHAERLRNSAQELKGKETGLQESIAQQHQALKALVSKVREAKKFVETSLEQQKGYENCTFQLVGAINTVR